ENLLLRVIALDLNREHGFLNFPSETLFRSEEQILAQLLGERASTFNHPPGHQVFNSGARDTVKVDAPVFVEVLVFDRHNGILHELANGVPRHDNTASK